MKQNDNFQGATSAAGAAPDNDNPIAALQEGLAHELDDMVKLELTAEQMLQDEAHLVLDYVAQDAQHFWSDIKTGLLDLEAATGEALLSAADPTSLEWQLGQWWDQNPHLAPDQPGSPTADVSEDIIPDQ